MKKSVFILILILPTICLLGMERDEGLDKERRNVSCVPEQPQRKKVHLNSAEQAEVDNRLVKAAQLGSIQLAEEAFQSGADINARYKQGDQLIHIAATNGHLEMVEWFIANEADIYGHGEYGRQPIHSAAHSGKLDVLKLLVEKGADINACTNGGNQPIHSAAESGKLNMVEWLIAHGALSKSKGLPHAVRDMFRSESLTGVVLTCTRNTQKIKAFLEDRFDEQDFNKTFPLMIARCPDLIKDEKFSGDMLAEVTEETWQLALEAAASHTNTDIFNWVYEHVRKKLPEDKFLISLESALLWATINGNERVVGRILERAFCDAHVSNLSLSAAGRRLNYVLIHNGSLTTEQRASLIRIRRMLIDAAQAINKTGLLAYVLTGLEADLLQPNDSAVPSLAQLPPELLTNIARHLFRE